MTDQPLKMLTIFSQTVYYFIDGRDHAEDCLMVETVRGYSCRDEFLRNLNCTHP